MAKERHERQKTVRECRLMVIDVSSIIGGQAALVVRWGSESTGQRLSERNNTEIKPLFEIGVLYYATPHNMTEHLKRWLIRKSKPFKTHQ